MPTGIVDRATSEFVVGSDSAWRSAKAQLQRRDRYGRFAEMGGGFSFSLRGLNGMMSRVTGTVVGQSGVEDVDVRVSGSDALPDGVYSIPSSKGEAVKAVLSKDALKGVDASKVKNSADDVFVSVDSIKRKDDFVSSKPASTDSGTSRVVNGVPQRDVLLPEGLEATDSLSDAIESGKPWSRLLPQGYTEEVRNAVDQITKTVDREKLLKISTLSEMKDQGTRAYDQEEITRLANDIYSNLASMGASTDGKDNGAGWSSSNATFIGAVIDADREGTSHSQAFLMTTAILERTFSDINAQASFEAGVASKDTLTRLAENYQHDRVMTVVPVSVLDRVLDSRRIKSQFETGESAGYLSPGFRGVLEAAQYGYPPGMNAAPRPIYGVSVPEKMSSADFNWSEQYGELKFVMKDSIKGRTTYTLGDSANRAARPAPIGTTTPTSLYQHEDIHAEAQMHGGVSLDDVSEVIVREGSMSPELTEEARKKIEAAGIKFTVLSVSNSTGSFVELKPSGATSTTVVQESTSPV